MSTEWNEGLADEALNDISSTVSLLRSRRSAAAKAMSEPGPTPEQVEMLLEIGCRVPDHGKLAPWRFILFEGTAREQAGGVLRKRWQALHPDHGEAVLKEQEGLFKRAPLVIAVVSRAAQHVKIPLWEQQLCAGAVCQNLLVGATAMGIGCQWITGWYAYDRQVLEAFGLAREEAIAGYIFLGTPAQDQGDRRRPVPASLVTRWQA